MPLNSVYNPMHWGNSTPRKCQPEIVVLHETNVSLDAALQYLRRPINTGYHYIVAESGAAHLLCPIDRLIYAATPSQHSRYGRHTDLVAVHIALETRRERGYSAAQYQTLSDLFNALQLPSVFHRDIHTGIEPRLDPRDFDYSLLPPSDNTDTGIYLTPELDAILYSVTGTHDLSYLDSPDIPVKLIPVREYALNRSR